MTKEELEFDQEDTIIVEPKSKKSDSSKKID
jgi:hypothetical protein